MGSRFDKLFGDGCELRDALFVVDEAVGFKDAAVAVVGVRAQADVAGDQEVRKAGRHGTDRNRRRIRITVNEMFSLSTTRRLSLVV